MWYLEKQMFFFPVVPIYHSKNKVVMLAKYLVVCLPLLCKFYECSTGKEFMQWELILE